MHTSAVSFLFTLLLPLLSFADSSHSGASVRRRASHRQRSGLSRSLESRDQATYYKVGQGACGGYNSDSDFVIALNVPQFGSGDNCYKMVTITANGKTAQAQVVDECVGCPSGGVDMSPSLFQFFGPLSLGVLDITWSFGDAKPSSSSTYEPSTSSVWTPSPTPTTSSTSKWASSTTTSSSSSSSSSVASTISSSVLTSYTPVPTPTPSPPSPNNMGDISALVISLGQLVLGSMTD